MSNMFNDLPALIEPLKNAFEMTRIKRIRLCEDALGTGARHVVGAVIAKYYLMSLEARHIRDISTHNHRHMVRRTMICISTHTSYAPCQSFSSFFVLHIMMYSISKSPRMIIQNLLIVLAFVNHVVLVYCHPTSYPTRTSSVQHLSPRRVAMTEETDFFTGDYVDKGWKVRYITVDIPQPVNIASPQLAAFYYKLRGLVPGITQSTRIAELQDTIHLGSKGESGAGLWLNIRSEKKDLNQRAVYEILDVLMEAAIDGWAPLFNAE